MRARSVSVLAIAVAAALAAAGGAPAHPQAAPAPDDQFFETIDVSVVNVDVYVTDKKGNPVRGLTRDDFQLFEDDKPIAITNFYAVDDGEKPETPATPPAPGAPPPATFSASAPTDIPEDQRLHLVVYIDNWNIAPFNRNRIFSRIRDFLRTNLTRADRVMLMTYDREAHVRRPFTSDATAVASALFEIERLSANGQRQDSERREMLRAVEEAEDGDGDRLLGRARMYSEAVFSDLRFSIDALKNTVSSLAGLPGRKAILYVSDGLPMVAGEDIFHAIGEKFPTQTGAILESRTYDTSRRFQELVAAANANRITFYTVEAAGLRIATGISVEEQGAGVSTFVDSVHWNNLQSTIRMMADDTGGIAIVNTNDPGKGLARVASDLRNYYSLGYSPAHSGDGRYHEIEVRTKNREWKIRHREGYRDKTVEARMSDGVMSALFHDVDSNAMGIRIDRGRERSRDDGHFEVPIEVRIPIGRLVLVPHGEIHLARLRIFVAAMDDEGRVSEVQESAVPVEIPNAEVATAMEKSWVFSASLVMRRGPQKLAVGVRDEVGQSPSFAVRTLNIGGG